MLLQTLDVCRGPSCGDGVGVCVDVGVEIEVEVITSTSTSTLTQPLSDIEVELGVPPPPPFGGDSENEAPDCPKIEHKSFKRMSYRACPCSHGAIER